MADRAVDLLERDSGRHSRRLLAGGDIYPLAEAYDRAGPDPIDRIVAIENAIVRRMFSHILGCHFPNMETDALRRIWELDVVERAKEGYVG